jgi:heme/copper-type cytochrome/quinol oxidase subunit 2
LFSHRRRLLRFAFAGITCSALAGCAGSLSTVDPAGPAAQVIATLWWVMLIGATLIFLMVMVLLAAAFRRGGDRVLPEWEDVDPAVAARQDDSGYLRIWIIRLGLVFSLSVLAALLAYGLVVGEKLLPRTGPEVVTVQAEGRQWDWTFRYADAEGLETENLLHIPAGRPIDVEITTVDVIHSFWVPRLAGKMDAIPGYVNVLRIEADAPGTYEGLSAEFSGGTYVDHRFRVVAHDADDWIAFLQGEMD